MASGYALPTHGHSHSYSSIHLSPGKAPPNAFLGSNGSFVKKAVSNGSLYSVHETSRETSREPTPEPYPNGDHQHHTHHNHSLSFDQNARAFQQNSRLSPHKHSHSESPMKSRPRGESDLGRPADVRSSAYRPTLESIPAASTSWFSLPEALTSLLIPLPYLLASAAYSSTSGLSNSGFPPLAAYTGIQQSDIPEVTYAAPTILVGRSCFINTCILTSASLLVVGILAKMQSSGRAFDKGKGSSRASLDLRTMISLSSLRSMATRALSLGLPFYASMQLGGTRTGLILLVAMTANLVCSDMTSGSLVDQWKQLWSSKVATSVVIILSFMVDEVGLTIHASMADLMLGYLALATSVLVLPPPLPTLAVAAASRSSSKAGSPVSGSTPWSRSRAGSTSLSAASPLTCSAGDVDITVVSGTILAILTVVASVMLSTAPSISASSIILITLAVASMASAVLFSKPSTLRSESKAGFALGCLITASCSFLYSPSLWPGTVCNGGLSALSFLSVLYDTNGSLIQSHRHEDHDHAHHHHRTEADYSALTKFIMARCEPGSLVFSILSEKDSRRIAYFTVLNFAFMLVQGAYGYLSGSLGLLSDTVHMFFDCLGLIVGLGAAVASKWPTSPDKPYGWGKLNTLAGFGNGIFLMLVSVEFVWEALEGMVEGRELRHVKELLVVSTLGLLVNMVGLLAFGHAHAGHDHGHSHGYSHSHEHDHSQAHGKPHADSHPHMNGHVHGHNHSHADSHANGHTHMNGHAHAHDCDHSHDHKPNKSHDVHDHDHNENMHGIFLHVAADAGGSLAVIISTALTLWKPWYLWDPAATILIAILIFAAAVPLVTSSGQKLLLVIPDELEYNIKNTLQELGELRGVVGYAVPRFWVEDRDEAGDAHDQHNHGHAHSGHAGKKKVLGVIHVIAAPSADLDDVRRRVDEFLAERNMNIVIHVEKESEGQCWCGGGAPHSG